MKRLSLDDISNAPSLPEKEIEIPEWDATVLVTGLTKADAVEINKLSEKDILVIGDTTTDLNAALSNSLDFYYCVSLSWSFDETGFNNF